MVSRVVRMLGGMPAQGTLIKLRSHQSSSSTPVRAEDCVLALQLFLIVSYFVSVIFLTTFRGHLDRINLEVFTPLHRLLILLSSSGGVLVEIGIGLALLQLSAKGSRRGIAYGFVTGGVSFAVTSTYLFFIFASWFYMLSDRGFVSQELLMSAWHSSTLAFRRGTLIEKVLFLASAVVASGSVLLLSSLFRGLPERIRLKRVVGCIITGGVLLSSPMLIDLPRNLKIYIVTQSHPLGAVALGGIVSYGHTYMPDTKSMAPRESLEAYWKRAMAFSSQVGAYPDVVLVIVEALRPDVINKRIGGLEITPNLNRLASRGYSWTALSQATDSASSLISMLSGRPSSFDRRKVTERQEVSLMELLSRTHRTAWISSTNEEWERMNRWTHSPKLDLFFDANSCQTGCDFFVSEQDIAFRRWVNETDGVTRVGTLDDSITMRRGVEWVNNVPQETPIFATIVLQASHFPYEVGNGIEKRFHPNELSKKVSFIHIPEADLPRLRNRYYNSLSHIDKLIGEMHAVLKQRHRDSILIVVGDHGDAFGEHDEPTHGHHIIPAVVRVPIIVEGVKGCKNTNEAMLLDLAPTIVRLVGLPPYSQHVGTSLLEPQREVCEPGQREPRVRVSSSHAMAAEEAVAVGEILHVYRKNFLQYHVYDMRKNEQINVDPDTARCLQGLAEEFEEKEHHYLTDTSLYGQFSGPALPRLGGECARLLTKRISPANERSDSST